jgi:hypothetical protein
MKWCEMEIRVISRVIRCMRHISASEACGRFLSGIPGRCVQVQALLTLRGYPTNILTARFQSMLAEARDAEARFAARLSRMCIREIKDGESIAFWLVRRCEIH